jgi:hypothetical protein
VQCCVELVAGAGAGEQAAGAAGGRRGRSEADEGKPGMRIAEAGNGPRPVLLALEAARGGCCAGLTPLDQAHATAAVMDLRGELLQRTSP